MAARQGTNVNVNASNGGYDYEFVHVPPKSLECPICLLTLRDPHVISCCGNHFCRPCIERVQCDRKPCPLCNENDFTLFLHKGVVREVNALVIWCPQKALGCQWKGELGSVERHHQIGCGFVEVVCVYGCGERFLRQLTGYHEAVCSKRPIKMQHSSMVQKLDVVLAENQVLKKVVQALKEDNCALREQTGAMEEEIRSLKKDNRSLKEEIARMKDTNSAMQSEVRKVGEKIAVLESTMRKMHHVVTPVPPQVFIVYNLEHLIEESLVWASPSFYSHVGGYKMKVVIYPNGHGSRFGEGISFFAGLVSGENDDELQWPFQGSVTIQVLNRMSKEWEEERTIDFLQGRSTCSRKPTHKRPNHYRGEPSYLPHTKLEPYTGETDSLRVRVACVKLN